ncbi:MAG: DUF6602 domain-containing protein [bacterium]
MDAEKYSISLTKEMEALEGRLGCFIKHKLYEGEWRETVLRTILRRHLPNTIGVGTGFIVFPDGASTQIDVLLYGKEKPLLFQSGEFVLVTPDAVKGVIEVKTSGKEIKKKSLKTLSEIGKKVKSESGNASFFVGIIGYCYNLPEIKKKKGQGITKVTNVLLAIQSCASKFADKEIKCVSLGKDCIIIFNEKIESAKKPKKWMAYKVEDKAFAYFVYFIICCLNKEWASKNKKIIFPDENNAIFIKDISRTGRKKRSSN